MDRYIYAFDLEESDGEVFFVFPAFPEIISAMTLEVFELMTETERNAFAEDAVLTALQSIISVREELPSTDNPDTRSASGFVYLSPLQAMKLQLYKVYLGNCQSVADFSRRIDKQDTAARRLLKLTHRSAVDEVEEALAKFGIKLLHCWATTQRVSQNLLPKEDVTYRETVGTR